jgi:FkbM family methyltransferase
MSVHFGVLNRLKTVGSSLHRTRIGGGLARLANAFLMGYWNRSNFDLESNGEGFLLRQVAALVESKQSNQLPIIFDVGANVGDWSLVAAKHFSLASIFAFELDPDTAAVCERHCAMISGHRTLAFGLSDHRGSIDFYSLGDCASGSSIERLNSAGASVKHGQITRGDAFCQEYGVDHIDLMKIDSEGHDLAVLRGFSDLLKVGGILCIQFEYGITSLSAKIMLRDFYDFLEPLGYSIGRLYRDGVEFKSYDHVEDEGHTMGNCVAVLTTEESGKALFDHLAIRKYGHNSV